MANGWPFQTRSAVLQRARLAERVQRAAGGVSVLIVLGFLAFGLWPFDPFPRNGVDWLTSESGLRFRMGSVIAERRAPSDPSPACSLELWVRSTENGGRGVILEFYNDDLTRRFRVEQLRNSGLMLREVRAPAWELMRVRYAFTPNEPTLITISSDAAGTEVYIDGLLAEGSSLLDVSGDECGGGFVLGTAADTDSTWKGDLLGLAIYDDSLTPGQVGRHYEAWREKSTPETGHDRGPAALYLFDEGSGSVARDRSRGDADLVIGRHFTVPHPPLLQVPSWDRLRPSRLNVRDIAINVAGFVPFGFFVCAWLSSKKRRRDAVIGALAAGFLISLAIETTQWYLPTRMSSSTDLTTNVFGTVVGVVLLLITFPRNAFNS